jgi:hypothetical protein
MKSVLALILFFGGLTPALASTPVVFFGGVASNTAVLNHCFPTFRNHGYNEGAAAVREEVAEINAHPDEHYIVAGHSSGAAYANEVASRVVHPERITLVDLDGFAPVGVPKAVQRVCWKAEGGRSGHLQSRNAGAMTKANNCEEVRVHQDSHCDTVWCMHFSLVNPDSPADLASGGRDPWTRMGYEGCSESRLEWLR